jgi:poly-gamma-glutamate system protein
VSNRRYSFLYLLFSLSLIFYALARFLPQKQDKKLHREMREASKIMAEAISSIRECRLSAGISIDEKTDKNRTGLIGIEHSFITTSLGSLEAKRTTANPNVAALLVFLLEKAGVKAGDAVAVGASSSFPALVVASAAAARARDVRLLVINSLGASQWGANNPDFCWLDIQGCLKRAGIIDIQPVALSLGGEGDAGLDMSAEGRAFFQESARASGVPFLGEPDLERNIALRLRRYEEHAGAGGVKAFINIGGSWANMGIDSSVLEVRPGLTHIGHIPAPGKRGVMQEMAQRGIPVIHLLNIKGLAGRYGLPWDPVPLPGAGEGRLYRLAGTSRKYFVLLAGLYLFLTAAILTTQHIFVIRRESETSGPHR